MVVWSLDEIERRAAVEPALADRLIAELKERDAKLAAERAFIALQVDAWSRGRAQAGATAPGDHSGPVEPGSTGEASDLKMPALAPLPDRDRSVLEAAKERLTREGFSAFEAVFNGATSPRMGMDYVNAKAGRVVVERASVMTTRYQRLRQAGWVRLDPVSKKNFPVSSPPPPKQDAAKLNGS